MATLGVKKLNVFHHDSSLNDVLSKTNLKNQIKPAKHSLKTHFTARHVCQVPTVLWRGVCPSVIFRYRAKTAEYVVKLFHHLAVSPLLCYCKVGF